jgi:hypothetical protein
VTSLPKGLGDLGNVFGGVQPHVDSPLALGNLDIVVVTATVPSRVRSSLPQRAFHNSVAAVATTTATTQDGSRQYPGAVGQAVDIVDAEQAETHILAGVVLVPVSWPPGRRTRGTRGTCAGPGTAPCRCGT